MLNDGSSSHRGRIHSALRKTCKDYRILGCDALQFGRSVLTFWRNLIPHTSKRIYSAYNILKMEAADSIKVLVLCATKMMCLKFFMSKNASDVSIQSAFNSNHS